MDGEGGESIDALQKEIAELKAEKVEWKGKAETAEREGRREDAKFAWKQYAALLVSVQHFLVSVQHFKSVCL
jgi:hypothetical protein